MSHLLQRKLAYEPFIGGRSGSQLHKCKTYWVIQTGQGPGRRHQPNSQTGQTGVRRSSIELDVSSRRNVSVNQAAARLTSLQTCVTK